MVISFEEKERETIEAIGITIIEFKRRFYNMEKNVAKAGQALREATATVVKALNELIERFLEAVDTLKLKFEEIREICQYPTSVRYRIVKVFSKCTGIDVPTCWKVTWKIKSRLARSCC